MGLITSITRLTGWLANRRNTSLSFSNNAGALLQLGLIVGPPCAFKTQNKTKFKTQKTKTVPLCEVGQSALLLVDLDAQFGQLLPQSFVHRLN